MKKSLFAILLLSLVVISCKDREEGPVLTVAQLDLLVEAAVLFGARDRGREETRRESPPRERRRPQQARQTLNHLHGHLPMTTQPPPHMPLNHYAERRLPSPVALAE